MIKYGLFFGAYLEYCDETCMSSCDEMRRIIGQHQMFDVVLSSVDASLLFAASCVQFAFAEIFTLEAIQVITILRNDLTLRSVVV